MDSADPRLYDGALVWTRFDNVWYVAVLADQGAAGVEAPEGTRLVQYLPSGEVACAALQDILPYDESDESKITQPEVQDGIECARELLRQSTAEQTAILDAAAADDENAEGDTHRREEKALKKAAKKLAKKEEKERKRAEKKARHEEKKRLKNDAEKSAGKSSARVDDGDKSDSSSDRDGAERSDDEGGDDNDRRRQQSGDDNELEEYLRAGGEGNASSGAPRLRDSGAKQLSSLTSRAGFRNLTDAYHTSAAPAFIRELAVGRKVFEDARAAAERNGMILTLMDVDFLRELEAKLEANSRLHQQLDHCRKQKLAPAFQRQLEARRKELKNFRVDEYARTLCVEVSKPPEKPEKRKGGKFAFVDSHLESLSDWKQPRFDAVLDPQVVQFLRNKATSLHVPTGRRTMRVWECARDVTTVRHRNEVQPVRAPGVAVKDRNEDANLLDMKMIRKASGVDRHVSEKFGVVFPRNSIGSYFNFHDFHYGQSGSLRDPLYLDEVPSVTVDNLRLSFDPDAEFGAEELRETLRGGLQGALVAIGTGQSSGMHQRSMGMPSSESMWQASAPLSHDSSTTHDVLDRDDLSLHRESGNVSPRSSGEKAAAGAAPEIPTWRSQVKEVILTRLSCYVHGFNGKKKILPTAQFSNVAQDLLHRAIVRKNDMDGVNMQLRCREHVALSEKDARAIAKSVDHYVMRHFGDEGGVEETRYRKRSRSVASHASQKSAPR